jgi:hypothetical protein
VVRISELTDARDIARRELRDPRVRLHWLAQQPRHLLTLWWLRIRAGQDARKSDLHTPND